MARPPAPHIRLVVTSRSDPPFPLSRWRARGQLTEIRAADLRFTADEAAAFLNQVMGLTLSASDIATLERRTEGWIVGLQLAALSMQGATDIPGLITAFSGSNRYILDYLVEEVFNQQSDAVQTFLLQTSVRAGYARRSARPSVSNLQSLISLLKRCWNNSNAPIYFLYRARSPSAVALRQSTLPLLPPPPSSFLPPKSSPGATTLVY